MKLLFSYLFVVSTFNTLMCKFSYISELIAQFGKIDKCNKIDIMQNDYVFVVSTLNYTVCKVSEKGSGAAEVH